MSFKSVTLLWALAMPMTLVQAQAADEKISLHFYERPPYLKAQADGSASGLTGTPAAEAFKKAGIAFSWEKTPAKRQLVIIEQNNAKDCGIGWYKNPEREAYGKFTKAIYRDKPTVALVSAKFNLQNGIKLATLLADGKARLLLKEGLTYGSAIAELVAKFKPHVSRTVLEQTEMVRMIKADRADVMFAPQEEASYFLEQAGVGNNEVRIVSFSDIPQGDTRHIMCSKQVDDQIIARLNAVITGSAN